MDINQIHEDMVEIVRKNEDYIKLVAERLMDDVAEYCVNNGVELHSDEYTCITNYATLWINTIFGVNLAVEKMKHQTAKPSDKLDID